MNGLPAQTARRIGQIGLDLGVRFEREAPMARCTSAGVGGPVPFLFHSPEPSRVADLLGALRETGAQVRILGNGTNLLVDDAGGPWVVVRLGGAGSAPATEGTVVRAPAGSSLPHLVRHTIRRGLRGLQHAEGIPGTVGAATWGNAGAFGGDMASVVRGVRLLREGRLEDRRLAREQFGYRSSPFGRGDMILEVEMELARDDPQALREEAAGYRARRLATQPIGTRSAGCVFRNPEGDAAGRLIEAAGLKGVRVGGAEVSRVHANFLLNVGGATAADFLALMDLVRGRVSAAFGIDLEAEVDVWRTEEAGA